MAESSTGEHPLVEQLPVFVAPAVEQEFNTVRASLIPIACWRVDDIDFAFDSSFPDVGIAQKLTDLKQLHDQHKEAPLSVFGHADPSGKDDYNKSLSGRRAAAIYALLTRRSDIWEDLFSDTGKFAKPVSGDNWGKPSLEVMKGKAGSDESVSTLQQNKAKRRKLFEDYMDSLCGQDFKLEKEDFLARGADPNGRGDFQGCGEFNPVLVFSKEERAFLDKEENHQERNVENQPNRRVMVMLFRPRTVVDPNRWPCPAAKEGVTKCKGRFFVDAEQRRSNQQERRETKKGDDTFACRFYDRLSSNSPCERFLALALDVTISVGTVVDEQAEESLLVLDSAGTVVQSIPPTDANKGPGLRHFTLGPGTLPNPVEVRWKLGELNIHVAGPCDPLELRNALVAKELEKGQTLIGTDQREPEGATGVLQGRDLGDPSDQPFGTDGDPVLS